MKKIISILLITFLSMQTYEVKPILNLDNNYKLTVCDYYDEDNVLNNLCQEIIINPFSHEYGPD